MGLECVPASAVPALTPGIDKVLRKRKHQGLQLEGELNEGLGKRRAQTRLRCVCNKFSFKVASSGIAGSRELSRVATMLLCQALQFGLFSALSCMHYPNKSVGISSEASTRGAVTPCPALSHKNGKYLQLLPGMRKIAFPSTLRSGHRWKLEEAGSFSFETSLYKGKEFFVFGRRTTKVFALITF